MSNFNPRLPYGRLIERLIDQQPNAGYINASQIGRLSTADLVAVLQHEPEVLADTGTGEALLDSILETLGNDKLGAIESASMLGAALLGAMMAQARQHLYVVVTDEIGRREEHHREWDSVERDPSYHPEGI